MPELPDVEAYLAALRERVLDEVVTGVRVRGVSVLKTYDPPVEDVVGLAVRGLRRLGKRIVLELREPDADRGDRPLFVVIHLMVAGRLWWRGPRAAIPRRYGLLALDFGHGTLLLSEAGTTHRASVHVERGEDALAAHDRGGIEPLEVGAEAFAAALTRRNRTLKRALTDPRVLSGIGNAFSDEILREAGLSPVQRTRNLDAEELERLRAATTNVLGWWRDRLVAAARESWPEEVTAFRDDFTVHGRFGHPCPVCGTEVQRIVYADRETNYCPTCQTDGRVLADRSLSRLLRDDWPSTVDELEAD